MLREFITQENLKVSPQTGGRSSRTKRDIFDDICQAVERESYVDNEVDDPMDIQKESFLSLSPESPLKELKSFIRNNNLKVRTDTGGYDSRTKEDIY
jgi:hypothetical protein